MTKFNKINEPFRKAKEMINVVESQKASDERTLKTLNRIRNFNMAKDNELFKFGGDLFLAGYSIDDVKVDIQTYAALLNEGKTANGENNIFKYEGITHIPPIEKFTAIAKNPNLFISIENGYNVEYRKNLLEKMRNDAKRK